MCPLVATPSIAYPVPLITSASVCPCTTGPVLSTSNVIVFVVLIAFPRSSSVCDVIVAVYTPVATLFGIVQ